MSTGSFSAMRPHPMTKRSRTVAKSNCACLKSLLLFAALAFPLAGGAGAREFRAADTQAGDYPTVRAIEYMGRLIEQRTDGRHRIRVFHSRQLREEKETIAHTRPAPIHLPPPTLGT